MNPVNNIPFNEAASTHKNITEKTNWEYLVQVSTVTYPSLSTHTACYLTWQQQLSGNAHLQDVFQPPRC